MPGKKRMREETIKKRIAQAAEDGVEISAPEDSDSEGEIDKRRRTVAEEISACLEDAKQMKIPDILEIVNRCLELVKEYRHQEAYSEDVKHLLGTLANRLITLRSNTHVICVTCKLLKHEVFKQVASGEKQKDLRNMLISAHAALLTDLADPAINSEPERHDAYKSAVDEIVSTGVLNQRRAYQSYTAVFAGLDGGIACSGGAADRYTGTAAAGSGTGGGTSSREAAVGDDGSPFDPVAAFAAALVEAKKKEVLPTSGAGKPFEPTG